jgi:hypothetical protein
MKKALFFSLFTFYCFISKSQGPLQIPTFQWALSGGGPSIYDRGYSVVTDNSGNVYAAGSYSGVVDFDPGPGIYTLTPSSGGFLAKYNSAKQLIWVKAIDAIIAKITFDQSGNLVYTGAIAGTVDLDPGPGTAIFSSMGFSDIVVGKLTSSGSYLWANVIGGNMDDGGNALAIDAADDILVTGYIKSASVDFSPQQQQSTNILYTMSLQDVFVLKLDATGNFIWVQQVSGTSSSDAALASAVACDANKNVYFGGAFTGFVDLDPGTAIWPASTQGGGAANAYVVKLDPTGYFVWAGALGSPTNGAYLYDLKVNATGTVYSTGSYYGVVDFDPSPQGTVNLTSHAAATSTAFTNDIFICKWDALLNFVWAKSIGGTQQKDLGKQIAIDNSDNSIYVVGEFAGTVDFDPGPQTMTLAATRTVAVSIAPDAFLAKYDKNGNFLWADGYGGLGDDIANGVAIFKDTIYSIGNFERVADFDPGVGVYTLTTPSGNNSVTALSGDNDFFLQKMAFCGVPSPPNNITSTSNQTICAPSAATLTVLASGTISWYSSPTATSAISSGSAYTTPALSQGTYSYYAEAKTCTNSATRTMITVVSNSCANTTGISEQNGVSSDYQPRIFPNPGKEEFYISLGRSAESAVVEMFNCEGKKVFSRQTEMDPAAKISIPELANGLYLVRILVNGKCVAEQKVMKE